jgi:hypothetical protein
MRYLEIADSGQPTMHDRLSTVSLYVLPHEWERLDNLRHAYAPSLVTARRDLRPRFEGHSVDVVLSTPHDASRMLADWISGKGTTSEKGMAG